MSLIHRAKVELPGGGASVTEKLGPIGMDGRLVQVLVDGPAGAGVRVDGILAGNRTVLVSGDGKLEPVDLNRLLLSLWMGAGERVTVMLSSTEPCVLRVLANIAPESPPAAPPAYALALVPQERPPR